MSYISDIDVIWMRYAIILAGYSNLSGDITVGAVLVYRGILIGYGWNSSIIYHDPSAHAEIIALRMGGKIVGNHRLLKTILYVTLEPCMMCFGAMIHARIYRLVCGARNNKNKWINLLWIHNILNHPIINHRIFIKTGILESVCSTQINHFFQCRRKFRKNNTIKL